MTGKVNSKTAAALAAAGQGVKAPGTSTLVGLRPGSLGNTVKQLQQQLIAAGVTVRGGADGIFGPATAQALKTFQTSQGLPATGVVDDKTVAALAAPKPAAPAAPVTSGYAAYGEHGSRVTELQTALTNAGITVRGGIDGRFGGGTMAAVIEFQRRKGLNVTGKVDAATAAALALAAKEPPKAPDPATVKLDVFPVQKACGFGDTWHAPRGGGRLHIGTDIIAATGNKLYAVVDGRISLIRHDFPGSLGGNALYLTTADGTYYYYAHLDKFAKGIEAGVPVKAGQVIGRVGSTGNASVAHLHFEVHPRGGAAVNPYPILKAAGGC